MIQAIENMNEFYKQKHTDFMHQAISLPGVTMRVYFSSITDPEAEFHLFNPILPGLLNTLQTPRGVFYPLLIHLFLS